MHHITSKLDLNDDGWPEGAGIVEATGMGAEKLDVAVYTIRALNDLEEMAASKGDVHTRNFARQEAEFTFLEHDGVSWNNNAAEHAIKALAALRRGIGGKSKEGGTDDYLILLSICETCKCYGVRFLDFLRSGEKDVHAFAESPRGRRRRSWALGQGRKPV